MPFDTFSELLLGEAGLFKLLGILKLVRVFRIKRIITYLRTTEELKAMINLVKVIFFVIVYVHCAGCLWWLIAPIDDTRKWISPIYYTQPESWYAVYDMEFT